MFAPFRHRPPPTRQGRRPVIEVLEGRQMLSLGAEFTVNSSVQDFKFQTDNASSSDGTSVVVWTDVVVNPKNNATDEDIHAQRFNALGAKLGPELIVAGLVGINEYDPHVAMDASGDFVVSWTQADAPDDTNVLAHKFNAAGVPVGGIVQVGVGTFLESQSDVAMDAKGNFVVSYTRETNDNNADIFAKRYNSGSQLLGVITVAASASAETNSTIAMTPDGRFDVAWQLQNGPDLDDIYAARYSAAGALLGALPVATSTLSEDGPSIAIDNSGNAVVAYTKTFKVVYSNGDYTYNYNVDARRISNTGVVGGEIPIHEPTSNDDFSPSVALAPTGGAFVVAYINGYGVEVSEVNGANTLVTSWGAGLNRWSPAISINAADQFLVTYTATGNYDYYINQNILGRLGTL